MLTFAHIFKSCSQDSCVVVAVMADVIRQLKIAMPGLKTVCYLKAGNDIETPKQMRDAILSSGGVPGVNVTLCETV